MTGVAQQQSYGLCPTDLVDASDEAIATELDRVDAILATKSQHDREYLQFIVIYRGILALVIQLRNKGVLQSVPESSTKPIMLEANLESNVIRVLGFAPWMYTRMWTVIMARHKPTQLFAEIEFGRFSSFELGSLERIVNQPGFGDSLLGLYRAGPGLLKFIHEFLPAYRRFIESQEQS